MESTNDAYTVGVATGELTLAKKATAKANFDDGVVLDVPTQTLPRHLQFYCKTTTSGNSEACDLRLAKRVPPAQIPTWPQGSSVAPSRQLMPLAPLVELTPRNLSAYDFSYHRLLDA